MNAISLIFSAANLFTLNYSFAMSCKDFLTGASAIPIAPAIMLWHSKTGAGMRLKLLVTLSTFFVLSGLLGVSASANETIEQRILRDPTGTYEDLSKRLREKGANASFPEFKPVVDRIIEGLKAEWFLDIIDKNSVLKMELEEVRTMLFHVNIEFSHEDAERYPYATPFEGIYPYRPTLDAIEKAVALFDKVDRLSRPDEAVSLYHFDRYAYHRHRIVSDPRVVIIPTMMSLGFNELIRVRSVPIGFIGVATRGLRVDRHYQTPLDFWYHDLNHVRRMVEYLFQTLRQLEIKSFEDEFRLYQSMDNFISNTLMPHLEKIPLREDRDKFAKRAMLRVIVFEILHESALPADRSAIIDDLLRRPGITQPFEVMLEQAPTMSFDHEQLRTETGNLRSGSRAFRDQEGKPVNIHFIHDRALALLANVYNKLTHGFFDSPDDPKNYVVPTDYRTSERILEAAKELFHILSYQDYPDDGTLLGWIMAREGSPEKFIYEGLKGSDKDLGGRYEFGQPKSVTEALPANDAIAIGNSLKREKQIVTFMGNSAMGYEHPDIVDEILIGKLRSLDTQKHVINSGSTKGGISRVYEFAKKMGFETMGVVSTQALTYAGQFSPYVDHHIIVNDKRWGGLSADGRLTPVTEVFVKLSDEIFAVGGGMNTAVTIEAFEALGNKLTYRAAEVNHESARREALYKKQPPPTTYEGAAFHTWRAIAAKRVQTAKATICAGLLGGK